MPASSGGVGWCRDEDEVAHAHRRPSDCPVARRQVADDQVVRRGERSDHLREPVVAGRTAACDLDAELVGEPGDLRPAGSCVETAGSRAAGRAHPLDDRELPVEQDGREETLAAVGAVEVAEVSSEVALGVEVDREHRPPGLDGETSQVRDEARLADTTLAVRDEEHVVEHAGLGVVLAPTAGAEPRAGAGKLGPQDGGRSRWSSEPIPSRRAGRVLTPSIVDLPDQVALVAIRTAILERSS